MVLRRRWILLALGVLALGMLALGLWQTLTEGGGGRSPWLYCTTNPCQPLALFPLPTPPALSTDPAHAATCDYRGPGASDGSVLWHTDWDPLTEQGLCVSKEEGKRMVGAK